MSFCVLFVYCAFTRCISVSKSACKIVIISLIFSNGLRNWKGIRLHKFWGAFMYLLLVVSGDEVVLSKIGIIFTLKVNFSFISATVLAEVAHSVQFCP